jgi:hypothetical protein
VQSAPRPPHPVEFDVEYPEQLSRLSSLFRLILAIPQLIVVYLLFLPLQILTFIAWFAILFTGRYPKAFFDFNAGVLRWGANVMAYVALLRDEYPPFSWEPSEYPLTLDIPRAERQSRWRLFVRIFSIIPNQIVFSFVQLAWFFTTFIAWWAILFTGRYPRGLHSFGAGVMRWYQRQTAYLYLLRDDYPPYSISADARPGNEVISSIIGFPIFAAYIAIYVLYVVVLFQGGATTQASLVPGAIARDHPSAATQSLRITLVDFERTSFSTSFEVAADQRGPWPAFFVPWLFSLQTCEEETYSVEDVVGDDFNWYWMDGSDRATVYFDIPRAATLCELNYFTGTSFISFEFR